MPSPKLPPVVLYHILFWILLWTVPMILLPIAEPEEDEETGLSGIVFVILMTSLFYVNLLVLYPRFLAKKKTLSYLAIALVTGLGSSVLYNLLQVYLGEIKEQVIIHILLKSIIAFIIIASSTAYQTIRDSFRQQREQQMKENENLKTELSFLRSQISPHFMFNVLNTLVALSRQKSDKLEEVVIELSHLLRYMLYESEGENVSLKTELEYLRSYIDIQMQRFGEDIRLQIDIPEEIPDKQIEPMLLIPLVENAFKHGAGLVHDPEINIKLEFPQNGLLLAVRNRFSLVKSASPQPNSGIGLSNLKRRLSLLYPNGHELKVQTEDDWFSVLFHLQLKETNS